MYKLLYIIAFCIAIQFANGQHNNRDRQKAILYDRENQRGESLQLHVDRLYPHLSKYDFDSRARSACITGVWVFYSERNYELGSSVFHAFGSEREYCWNFINGMKPNSARFVGSGTNYRADTLTLYEGINFTGEEEYVGSSIENLRFRRHRSLIITGREAWTVYNHAEYRGQGKCIYPENGKTHSPRFLRDMEAEGIGRVRSARKGCHEGGNFNPSGSG